MKIFILRLVLLLALYSIAFVGQAQNVRNNSSRLSADTLAGEARLTHAFAQRICTQISMESRHQDLAMLSKEQGAGLLQNVLTAAILQDSVEFTAFIAQASNVEAVVQRLSVQAVLKLRYICPAASKLLTQMGVQMAGLDTTLSSAQQQIIQTVAQDICGQLAKEDALHPFATLTAAQRLDLYYQARINSIRTHGQALIIAFGDHLLHDKQAEDTMWRNIDRLMFDSCPSVTSTLRVDRGLQNMQTQSSPTQPSPQTKTGPSRHH